MFTAARGAAGAYRPIAISQWKRGRVRSWCSRLASGAVADSGLPARADRDPAKAEAARRQGSRQEEAMVPDSECRGQAEGAVPPAGRSREDQAKAGPVSAPRLPKSETSPSDRPPSLGRVHREAQQRTPTDTVPSFAIRRASPDILFGSAEDRAPFDARTCAADTIGRPEGVSDVATWCRTARSSRKIPENGLLSMEAMPLVRKFRCGGGGLPRPCERAGSATRRLASRGPAQESRAAEAPARAQARPARRGVSDWEIEA
jgi:hypothetical protein